MNKCLPECAAFGIFFVLTGLQQQSINCMSSKMPHVEMTLIG